MAVDSDGVMEEDLEKETTENKELPELIDSLNSSLRIDVKNDDTTDSIAFEDDDAAVIIQELAYNYAISTRTPPSRGSAVLYSALAKSASRRGSITSPRSLFRNCMTKAIVDISLKTKNGEGQIGRLLSAKRNHINELSNDIVVLQKRIKELEAQNRVLVRISKRQESTLKKFYDMETELPHLLEAHRMEIRILQDKLRKALETNKKDDETIRCLDSRVLKMSDELYILRELSRKKNLPERDQLSKKLSTVLKELQDKEKENQDLNKKILITDKSMRQQVTSEIERHRSTAKMLYSLRLEHQKTLDKLKNCEKELGSLQQYRSRGARNLSSSYSSSTNISTSTETPLGTCRSGTRRLSRKSTSRRLKTASNSNASTLPTTPKERTLTTYVRSPEKSTCIFDSEERDAFIDLDMRTPGWTTECTVNAIGCCSNVDATTERLGSERLALPPLSADIRGRKKPSDASIQLSSENLSDESESRNQSNSNDYQISGVTEESASRKTTILSNWSDDTREGDSPISRGNTPPAEIHTSINDQESCKNIIDRELRNSEEEFFNVVPSPEEVRRFSLIENYPPKERRKLDNGLDPSTSASSDSSCSYGTTSPPRELETLTCGTPIEAPFVLKLRGEIQPSSRSTSAVKKSSFKRHNSLLSADFRTLSSLSFAESSQEYK